jgi:hypothetical protein
VRLGTGVVTVGLFNKKMIISTFITKGSNALCEIVNQDTMVLIRKDVFNRMNNGEEIVGCIELNPHIPGQSFLKTLKF